MINTSLSRPPAVSCFSSDALEVGGLFPRQFCSIRIVKIWFDIFSVFRLRYFSRRKEATYPLLFDVLSIYSVGQVVSPNPEI